jgi:hypothetical protein
MRQSVTAILFAIAASALAQNKTSSQTIEYFFPGNPQGYAPHASIVSANPTQTVMKLTCPTTLPDFDDTECGWGPGVDFTAISSTIFKGTMMMSDFTMTYSCDHNTKEKAMTCDASIGGSGADFQTSEVAVLKGTDATMLTATLTAGAEKLSAATGAAASTTGGVKATASQTGLATVSGGRAAASGANSTGTGLPPQSTGAAGRFVVEGSALLVLMGAVVMNAL